MRLLILETGIAPSPLDKNYGSYGQMFERMMARVGNFDCTAVKIFENQTPPPISEFDGLLITGSPAGVYEGHPWIAQAQDIVRMAARAGKPQIGICFGHQLMAQAFGGVVEKSAKGWGVGVHRYQIFNAATWMTPALQEIACAVSHQDQVITPPAGAMRLAGSDFCENGALAYAQGPAISFQMHPEFGHDFAEDLLRARLKRIPQDISTQALSTFKDHSDRESLARWIASFLTHTHPNR